MKDAKGRRIDRELLRKGNVAKSRSWKGLDQEQPRAYRDVDVVADGVHKAGLSTKIARLRPIGVIKG
jgi:tRNA-splicing ligase RtcB